MEYTEDVLDNKLLILVGCLLILVITVLSVYVFIAGGDFIPILDAIY